MISRSPVASTIRLGPLRCIMRLNNTGQNVLKQFPFAVGKRSDDPIECSPYGRTQSSSDLQPASCQRESRQAFARAKLCLDKPPGGKSFQNSRRIPEVDADPFRQPVPIYAWGILK